MTTTLLLGDGTRLAYRLDGDPAKPPLILSNSIATDHTMWDDNLDELTRHFYLVRYDTRGHGGSDAPPGAYSVERLGLDVLALMDYLGIARAHFLGLSLGGFIGEWLGVHAPERIDRLVLSNTAPHLSPASFFDARIAGLGQENAMVAAAESFLANWFPAAMREENGATIQRFRSMILRTPPRGLAGSFAAVRDADLRNILCLIRRPTLVIGGDYDTVTLPEHSREIAAAIPGAELVMLPTVHLPNVESPREYMEHVLRFLSAERKD
ncbi:alpha/beta fold hydrolase [Massilia endophytica]|uniref:alpha/beta fold hydrolase n=1 Tax=Massilia endophytica TaxID=2899220 RepID=UPI001E432C13|nr:alpha/beta fold hydrolase [Massilia endophytica]UGQ45902.1 alpha/beta fold hydrolase [Massilia endophytica]